MNLFFFLSSIAVVPVVMYFLSLLSEALNCSRSLLYLLASVLEVAFSVRSSFDSIVVVVSVLFDVSVKFAFQISRFLFLVLWLVLLGGFM